MVNRNDYNYDKPGTPEFKERLLRETKELIARTDNTQLRKEMDKLIQKFRHGYFVDWT
jgi:hypothetical protein